MNVTFQSDQTWAIESPVKLIEGEGITFTCTYWDTPTTVSCKVYVNNSDKTSTVMPGVGATSVSGKVATLKPATAMVFGRYIFAVTATVAAETRIRKFMAIVARDESE